MRVPFVSRRRYDDLDNSARGARLRISVLESELKACNESRERLLTHVATAAANTQSLNRQLTAVTASREYWRKKWMRYQDSITEADAIARTQADAAEESNRAALDELEALR